MNNSKSEVGAGMKRRAVAIGYDPERDDAPVILASGPGFIADQIIALAKKNNIPLREDVVLTEALSKVALNENIPSELYVVVAEVLAYVYRINKHRTSLQTKGTHEK